MKILLRFTILLFSLSITYPMIGQTLFQDVTVQSGINHVFKPFQGTFGGGAVVLDYDNDGWEDIYLTSGSAEDALFKNLGNGTFKNVIDETGILLVTNKSITQGVTTADVNKDGCIDLFITTIASSDGTLARTNDLLFINQCDGTFRDMSKEYKLLGFKTFSTGASFGDFNNDGFPDLFVANYFNRLSERLDHFSGNDFDKNILSSDQLYLNVNGEYFEEVSFKYGITHVGLGFGGYFTDYDNDNDLDLMVINDFGDKATPNLLYRNDHPFSKFTDVSGAQNFNLGMNGMGVAAGDYNNDGWMDYFITNITASPFYVGIGENEPFKQSSKELGTAFHFLSIPNVGSTITICWGTNFFDYDHDGDLDLFIANGALNPSVQPNPNLMLENFDGYYRNLSDLSGLGDIGISRGSIILDYDHDGDMDLLVVNQEAVDSGERVGTSRTKLYKNNSAMGNWFQVKLQGHQSDYNGIGSRIEIIAGGQRMIREIEGGSGHESQSSRIAHFGLGNASIVDTLIVKWIGRSKQIFTNISVNRRLKIVENNKKFDVIFITNE